MDLRFWVPTANQQLRGVKCPSLNHKTLPLITNTPAKLRWYYIGGSLIEGVKALLIRGRDNSAEQFATERVFIAQFLCENDLCEVHLERSCEFGWVYTYIYRERAPMAKSFLLIKGKLPYTQM